MTVDFESFIRTSVVSREMFSKVKNWGSVSLVAYEL